MKHLLPLLLVALLGGGCNLAEKYAKNNAAASAWLAANSKAPARTNFEGTYYSPDWGVATLNQKSGKVTGAISYHNVRGIVSGKLAYLTLIDDQWVEYTMILGWRNHEELQGAFSPAIPFCKKSSKPVSFDKIDE